MEKAHELRSTNSTERFEAIVIEVISEIVQFRHDLSLVGGKEFPHDKVQLFNPEKHTLKEHQLDAVRDSILGIVLSEEKHSGYCFMPTSAGKSYIIITIAALAVSDFKLFRIIHNKFPKLLNSRHDLFPLLINLSFRYSTLIDKAAITRTQILVHDIEILQQLRIDTGKRLPTNLAERISFFSVQAHRNEQRRKNVKYLIVDENHWGNASPEETLQSELVADIKANGGKAFGFTASPYEHPDSKYQRTWSNNKINQDRDFNYYLDNNIIHNGLILHEINLQNARLDYVIGGEEIELTEKKQVIDFMTKQMLAILPPKLDFPGICFFNAVIIPDIVRELINNKQNGAYWRSVIKILGSDDAQFIEKCRSQFGEDILATDQTIKEVTDGKPILLVSQQKLLVGFNAPHLRYCFISPTNSKIKILQGLGRLMRPSEKVERKIGVLFLTSLSGKKMDIGEKKDDAESTEREPCSDCGLKICDCACEECGQPRNTLCECPKGSYKTTSLTLTEAYDLPIKVFYKAAVEFRDFINQTRVNDANSVLRIASLKIPKDELDALDDAAEIAQLRRTRELCRVAYKNQILARDKNKCVMCHRGQGEVGLEIHHKPPFEFAELMRTLGADKTIEWHSNPQNWKHLETLCKSCHDESHRKLLTDLKDAS